jgi:hypothetical protein
MIMAIYDMKWGGTASLRHKSQPDIDSIYTGQLRALPLCTQNRTSARACCLLAFLLSLPPRRKPVKD